MAIDIVAFGEPMIEFNQTEAGSRRYLQGFGGDTSNFAVAAARQGARAGVMTALGADGHGRLLRELWAREGVDDTLVRTDPVAPTGVYFVSHGPEGHAFSFARSGSAASRYAPADLPLDALREAKALHLSGISLAISPVACDAGHAAMAAVRAAGGRVSFDTNLRLKLWPRDRARAVILDAIGLADIALPSLDDVVALVGEAEPEAIVEDALRRGCGTVALKLGSQGALVASAAERHRIPSFPVTPVDATGAGDTFGGAFVARLLAGDGLAAAGRYAAVAAALSTQGYGAVEPIPRRAEVEAALASWG